MNHARNLVIKWKRTTAEWKYWEKNPEEEKYIMSAEAWWDEQAKLAGKEPIECTSGMEVAIAVAEFTGTSFKYGKATFQCGHSKAVPLPLSIKDSLECNVCDYVEEMKQSDTDPLDFTTNLGAAKMTEEVMYWPTKTKPNRKKTFEMESKATVTTNSPEIELCFELKDATWVISAPSPMDTQNL